MPRTYSYLSPKLEARPIPGKGGYGVFAVQPVKQGEVLTVWGGRVTPLAEYIHMSEYEITHALQIEDGLFMTPLIEGDPADQVNHSCDPNAGVVGQISLAAMRDIAVGEEVSFDYAMSESQTPEEEFECGCGSPRCRGKISWQDWKRPELQAHYKGYFSVYLQRKIDALNK